MVLTDSRVLNPYFPLLLTFITTFGLTAAVSGLSLFLGPHKGNLAKNQAYECGLPMQSNARQRLSVKFYLTAILFILFDIETVFMYLWAVAFDFLKWFGVLEMGFFVFTLVLGYLYVLKRGALSWET